MPDAAPAAFAYWIVCRKEIAGTPKIRRFREWLLAEADSDIGALGRPADA